MTRSPSKFPWFRRSILHEGRCISCRRRWHMPQPWIVRLMRNVGYTWLHDIQVNWWIILFSESHHGTKPQKDPWILQTMNSNLWKTQQNLCWGKYAPFFLSVFFSAGWSTSCSSTGAILVGLGDIFSLLLLGVKVTFKHLPFNSWTSLTDP